MAGVSELWPGAADRWCAGSTEAGRGRSGCRPGGWRKHHPPVCKSQLSSSISVKLAPHRRPRRKPGRNLAFTVKEGRGSRGGGAAGDHHQKGGDGHLPWSPPSPPPCGPHSGSPWPGGRPVRSCPLLVPSPSSSARPGRPGTPADGSGGPSAAGHTLDPWTPGLGSSVRGNPPLQGWVLGSEWAGRPPGAERLFPWKPASSRAGTGGPLRSRTRKGSYFERLGRLRYPGDGRHSSAAAWVRVDPRVDGAAVAPTDVQVGQRTRPSAHPPLR